MAPVRPPDKRLAVSELWMARAWRFTWRGNWDVSPWKIVFLFWKSECSIVENTDFVKMKKWGLCANFQILVCNEGKQTHVSTANKSKPFSSPLEAPLEASLKLPISSLEALLKPPWSPLQPLEGFTKVKPPSSPLEAPWRRAWSPPSTRPFKPPFKPSEGEGHCSF